MHFVSAPHTFTLCITFPYCPLRSHTVCLCFYTIFRCHRLSYCTIRPHTVYYIQSIYTMSLYCLLIVVYHVSIRFTVSYYYIVYNVDTSFIIFPYYASRPHIVFYFHIMYCCTLCPNVVYHHRQKMTSCQSS